MKPRILRITNRLNLGGPTFNVAYLTKYLDKDFDTLLLTGMLDKGEASSEFILNDLGIEPVYINEMYRDINPLKDYASYGKIKDIIKKFKPDIVHTHAAKSGAVGRLAANHSNVRGIVHTFHGHVFHGYFGAATTRFYLEMERYLATKTNRLIALSHKQKQELTQIYKIAHENKFEIIQLGFDLDRFTRDVDVKRQSFRSQYAISDEEIAIGIIGRLVPIKNHKLFVDAVIQSSYNTDKRLCAVMIGDGTERSFIESYCNSVLASNTTLNNKIRFLFTGWRKDIDVCNAGLDIICLTSNNEGTPVSLIEAQAVGRPIVSTNVGGVEDIVINGVTAYLTPPRDVDTFSANLSKLISSEQIRSQMSLSGRNFVIERFSYQRLCAEMSMLYFSLI